MRDFLEELEVSDALLEAVRRMDGVLEVLERSENRSTAEEERAGGPPDSREALERETVLEGMVRRNETVGIQARRGGSSLLEAVESAERRRAGMGALEMPRRSTGVVEAPVYGVGRGGVRRPRGETPNPGRGVTAEEVDRMFRRDSRRYDGGFFLY